MPQEKRLHASECLWICLAQMSEEFEITGRGSGGARADILFWASVDYKNKTTTLFIIIECKADNIQGLFARRALCKANTSSVFRNSQ